MRFVRGFTWKCRMCNGATFEWWTPSDQTRTEARQQLLAMANTGCHPEAPAYVKSDMENLWRTDGKPTDRK